jgi:hypothetical protein
MNARSFSSTCSVFLARSWDQKRKNAGYKKERHVSRPSRISQSPRNCRGSAPAATISRLRRIMQERQKRSVPKLWPKGQQGADGLRNDRILDKRNFGLLPGPSAGSETDQSPALTRQVSSSRREGFEFCCRFPNGFSLLPQSVWQGQVCFFSA